MTSDNTIALYQSALERGALSPEQQIAAAKDFAAFIIEFRVMRTTLDEIYQNEREQDELSRALPIENIVPFPRRPVPVRLAMAPVVALEWPQ